MDKPTHIGAEVRALNNLIKRKLDAGPLKDNPKQPTGMQGMIMGFIALHADTEVFQRDIETEFKIRRSTATGILKLMERDGLIVKESVPYDERLKKLVLTPDALAMHEQIIAHLWEIENQLKKNLTQDEMDSFFHVVEIMKSNIS